MRVAKESKKIRIETESVKSCISELLFLVAKESKKIRIET